MYLYSVYAVYAFNTPHLPCLKTPTPVITHSGATERKIKIKNKEDTHLPNLEAISIGAVGSPRKCHPWNENGKRKTMEHWKALQPRNFDMTGPMHSVTTDRVQRTSVCIQSTEYALYREGPYVERRTEFLYGVRRRGAYEYKVSFSVLC